MDEFRKSDLYGKIEIRGEYLGSQTKILCYCTSCDYEYSTYPLKLLKAKGCTKCKRKTHITHEQFVKKFNLMDKAKYIEIRSRYIGSKNKIKCYCKIHDYEFDDIPNELLRKRRKGCKYCGRQSQSKSMSTTHEQFMERFNQSKAFGTISILGKYTGANNNIDVYCEIHKYHYKANPYSLLKCSGCFKCKIDNHGGLVRMTNDEYDNRIFAINQNIKRVDDYICRRTKIKHKCLVCEHEWLVKPGNTLKGRGCPECSESHLERSVSNYLRNNNILYSVQKQFDDCRNINPLKFDFYLSDFNILIETNGRQHYEPVEYFGGEEDFKKQHQRDQIKRDYCKKQNIKLIEIPYWDANNIDDILAKELCLEVVA